MTTFTQRALLMAAALAVTASASGSVLHVRADASGAGTGDAWADAYPTLQAALAAAQPGDEIWVAAGTYTPTDSVSSFVLRSGVSLFGGFSGTEISREDRDWTANPTILSGDIGGDDTVDPSPFLGWPNNVRLNTANAGHVVVASGVGAGTVLDGFRIVKGAYGPAGVPAGDPLLIGSGLYCVGGSPTVRNCAFSDNFAAFGHGGAVYLYDSDASVSHCTFHHNLAGQGSGGAIFVGGAGSPTISDCTFTSNLATASSGQTGQGGAIQLNSTGAVTIAHCVFTGNIARAFGGSSFETPRGGAVSSFSLGGSTVIRECTLRDNQSTLGGGMFLWNPTSVINCLIDHNTALVEGAGIGAQWTTAAIENCTIINNVGAESAGIMCIDTPPNLPGEAFIRNSIVWGNVANGQDVSPRNAGIRGNYTALYSCIQDLFTADPGEDPIDPSNYPGCIAVNPQLGANGEGAATPSRGVTVHRCGKQRPGAAGDDRGPRRPRPDRARPDRTRTGHRGYGGIRAWERRGLRG